MKYLLFLLSTILYISFAFSQPANKNDGSSIYQVGYQNIIVTDSSRIYKPNTNPKDKLHYRPLEIDILYPASAKLNSLMQYGELINLLEERSNRFQNDTSYKGLSSELVQYICSNLKIIDTAKLIHLNTSSYKNANTVKQKFPLIIYMCAFNGMSYENISLFEKLSSHGYVVACITSVGRYPGNMSTTPADLMEQVYDGLFTIDYLRHHNNIDSTKIGVIGYSWGGLAALALSMNSNNIKCILSFDGSEIHYYGESNEEDKNFNELKSLSFFQSNKIKVPYAYLESNFKQDEQEADSIFNILPFLAGEKKYARFLKATHEDFSCLPSIASQIVGINDNRRKLNMQLSQFALNYFNQYLKDSDNNLLSSQLSAIYRQHIADSVYPIIIKIKKNDLTILGRVMDKENNEPLAYVNVGVPNKNIGTVTRHDGSFLIKVNQELQTDSIEISMVGYQSQIYSIADFLKQKTLTISLKEKATELKQVVVIARALQTKKIGNTTTSKFIGFGFPLKFLGSEIGVKLNLGKKPVLLKNFNFTVSDNRLDTAVFRLNIYTLKKGAPFENILPQNIIIGVGKRTGTYTINLTEYKLVMKDDIMISLEWIEGSSTAEHGAIFLSAGFLNSATWRRQTSQGSWKKFGSVGVGFNLTVQKLND